ncbi:hypothetical protein [Burkholderia ubonensis]|uniref:hypothetical protein n=1 Tax=Burkholderia ubonensis TaxID=101571 RepID=UPI00075C6D46|nr:hypothetical protein [Burkholderia ubonensis]KVD31512.1 hypothetical protein WI82_09400 [Burkholderia ubonensis]
MNGWFNPKPKFYALTPDLIFSDHFKNASGCENNTLRELDNELCKSAAGFDLITQELAYPSK